MELLADYSLNKEIAFTCPVGYQEVVAEKYEFQTTEYDEMVRIDATIPFTIHQALDGAANGAFRLYLDGDAFIAFPTGAKQWNGKLVINGGGFCEKANLPFYSRVSGSWITRIANPGLHTLRLMYAGQNPYTVGTIKVWRRVQVSK